MIRSGRALEAANISGIYEATNGQEAIRIMQEHQPAVVFTDMRMPLMDGAELLECVHRHYPHTKTIVISGYQDFNYVKPAILYGGTDYLLKPLNSKQLIASAEHAFKLYWRRRRTEAAAAPEHAAERAASALLGQRAVRSWRSRTEASFHELKRPSVKSWGCRLGRRSAGSPSSPAARCRLSSAAEISRRCGLDGLRAGDVWMK